jgi:hypothetical protein
MVHSPRADPGVGCRRYRRSVNGDMRIPESNDLENTDNGMYNFDDPWEEDRRRVIVFDQGNNTAFGKNLTSTVDDSLSPWGFTRGEHKKR